MTKKKLMTISQAFAEVLGQKALLGLLRAPSVPLFTFKQATGSNGLLRYLDQEISADIPPLLKNLLTLGDGASSNPWTFVTGIDPAGNPLLDHLSDDMTLDQIREVIVRVDANVQSLRALSGNNEQDPLFKLQRRNIFDHMGTFNSAAKAWALQQQDGRLDGPYFRVFNLGSMSEFWPITEFSKGSNSPVSWQALSFRDYHTSNLLFENQLSNGDLDNAVLLDYLLKGINAAPSTSASFLKLLRRANALSLIKNVGTIAAELMREGAAKTSTQNFLQVSLSVAAALELLISIAVVDVLSTRIALVQQTAHRMNIIELVTLAFSQPEILGSYDKTFATIKDFLALPVPVELFKMMGSEVNVPYNPEDPEVIVSYISSGSSAGSQLSAILTAISQLTFDPLLADYYRKGCALLSTKVFSTKPIALDTRGDAIPVAYDHLPAGTASSFEEMVTKPLLGPSCNLADGWYKSFIYQGSSKLSVALPYNRGIVNASDLTAEFNLRLNQIKKVKANFSALKIANLPVAQLSINWGFEERYLYIGARTPQSVRPLNQLLQSDQTPLLGDTVPVSLQYGVVPLLSSVAEENYPGPIGFSSATKIKVPIGPVSEDIVKRLCSIAGVSERPINDALLSGAPLPANYPTMVLSNIKPDYSTKTVEFQDIGLCSISPNFAEEAHAFIYLITAHTAEVAVVSHSLMAIVNGIIHFTQEARSIPLVFKLPRTGWHHGLDGVRGSSFFDTIAL